MKVKLTPLVVKKKFLSKKDPLKAPISKAIKNPIANSKLAPIITKITQANQFPVVAIGASAGGLEAMTQLLRHLSPNTGMAFIYVQHLSPDHKSILSTLLSKETTMKVQVIDDTEKMKPNNVYVIPYDKNIEVTNGHIKLIPREKNKKSNLSIDVLFSSLAETHKENVIGIVLSGNASDGTKGLKKIKFAGGITFAQDDSAKYSSMPKSAIAEGVVDFILSPKDIAMELTCMSEHPQVKRVSLKTVQEDKIENSNPHLKSILQLLHKKKNVDFSNYKMNTIKRRMLRRMLIHKIKTLKQYAQLLVQNNNEIDLLYHDLLINVTDFFRDTDAFLLLKKTVLPKLLKSKASGETLRIWIAACATGEEVYSIAMMLLEIQGNKTNKVPFQIFASDLSTNAISEARIGEYSLNQLQNVSAKRLQYFFTKIKDKYRITKSLRDVCVFAQHNILRDPPFSRMDFISCRNLLIYLDTSAQKKVIATFHYALNEGGSLMLGKSETIGTATQLFTPLNKKYKVYTCKKNTDPIRKSVSAATILETSLPEKNNNITTFPKKQTQPAISNLSTAFDSVLLSNHVPASVVINYDLEILQFRGSTSLYLQHSSGKASFNILKMANIEITFELRNAIHHAIKTKHTVRKTGIEMNRDKTSSAFRIVNLEVIPLTIEGEEPLLVIVFSGQQQVDSIDFSLKGGKNNSIAKDRRIRKLEEELAAARSDMGAITHDQEAANEELQSANEEIVSSNEELQSLNEELETSKEEIESANEELTTSNQELQARNLQVEELYSYYQAILDTVHEPVLILDKNIRIKTANKSFCKMFHVTEEESIGVSLYKLGNNQWNILRLRELLEEIVPKNIQFHDFEVEHTFPTIGHKTMLLNAHRVIQQSQNEELIVLTITDITEVKRLAIELQVKENKVLEVQIEIEKKATKLIEDSEKNYRNLIQSLPVAVYTCDKNGLVQLYNKAAVELWGREPKVGKDFWYGSWKLFNSDGTPLPLEECSMFIALKEERAVLGQEIIIEGLDGVQRNVMPNPQPIFDQHGKLTGIINTLIDITAQKRFENELVQAKSDAELKTQIAEDALKAKQQFLSNMSHEIRTPMNAVVGFTNVVLKTTLSESQKEYINAIKISGDALIVLIDDILDLAKVDSGKMTFDQSPFNLSSSICAMLQLFETKIGEKNLELIKVYDNTIPQVLLGDPMRLRQIILNLVSNAVKFTSKGSITMSVHLLKEDTKQVIIEFSLTDTGIGIPKDRIQHIFNDFEQVSRETFSSYGGTGLGLAIVKQLVELQGGTIIVNSKVGVGSTFGFIMNFEKTDLSIEAVENLGVIQKQSLLAMNLKKIKVLVVEDLALNQLLIKIIIADFGFELDIANNGKIAVEKLQKNHYDIVLMDLQMPEMNGFEATSYIRNKLKSQIPIIALTADVTTVDIEKCKKAGMNDYISKPIDEKLLYSKMVICLKKSGSISQ